MEKYDVIIVGASFAGLAVASRITKGKVLLINRKDIGSHQQSACGTTVEMVKELGCEKSILKTFDTIALHIKDKEMDIPLPEKFCTIDYEIFCRTLFKRSHADFIKANVERAENSDIITSAGNFGARIIVDCSGWQAVLASSLDRKYTKNDMISFGVETDVPYEDNKLRFFIDPRLIKNGVAWLFPCKNTARFGVASYAKGEKLLPKLKSFVGRYGMEVGQVHGGDFCYCFKDPIVKGIFVVGCAAGQTLPLTGEGIRRSVYSGLACGKIIQSVLDGRISLAQGQQNYRDFALKGEKDYSLLLKIQNAFPTMPIWQWKLIGRVLGIRPIAKLAWRRYKAI